MATDVNLTASGGWLHLFDIKCSVGWSNLWNFVQTCLLGLILWRLL